MTAIAGAATDERLPERRVVVALPGRVQPTANVKPARRGSPRSATERRVAPITPAIAEPREHRDASRPSRAGRSARIPRPAVAQTRSRPTAATTNSTARRAERARAPPSTSPSANHGVRSQADESGHGIVREGVPVRRRARTAVPRTGSRMYTTAAATPNRSPPSRIAEPLRQQDRDRREDERGRSCERPIRAVARRRSPATTDDLRAPPGRRRSGRDVRAPRYHAIVFSRPVAQRCARSEAEQPLGAGRVELPARLAVRHRGVPDDLAARSRSARRSISASSRIDVSTPVPRLTGSGPS